MSVRNILLPLFLAAASANADQALSGQPVDLQQSVECKVYAAEDGRKWNLKATGSNEGECLEAGRTKVPQGQAELDWVKTTSKHPDGSSIIIEACMFSFNNAGNIAEIVIPANICGSQGVSYISAPANE